MKQAGLLTEDRLREWGFRWEQGDRQPSKHWTLWIAPACVESGEQRMFACIEDLGIEVASIPLSQLWHCWIRADYAGRYTRLLHVRRIATEEDLVCLIEAMTGREWNSNDVMSGAFRSPEEAQGMRENESRLDNRIASERLKHLDIQPGIDPSKIGLINR